MRILRRRYEKPDVPDRLPTDVEKSRINVFKQSLLGYNNMNAYGRMERGSRDMESSTEKDMLQVQMLGDFCLTYNGKVLSGESVRAKQVWNLLEYIAANRGRENSLDRIIEALWEEGDAEDPANALKNLAYRLRTTLKNSLGLPASDYIVFKHGTYSWNMEAPCVFDTDLFEEELKRAKQQGLSREEIYQHYSRAVSLYKGNYMPQASYKQWAQSQTAYYQRLFMEAAAVLSGMLLEDQRYAEAEDACRAAIACDPFVEVNHINLIHALVGSNNQKKAREHYEFVCRLYLDELGVKPSDTITKIYMDVINQNAEFERDLATIKEELKEDTEVKGALMCNFEVFRSIYRLQARAALRSGSSIYIALLTATGRDGAEIRPEMLERIVDNMTTVISSFLRKDDMVCRYGRAQFLIMLANITYENMGMVLDRLIRQINACRMGQKVEVHGQVRALDPVELEEKRHD